VRVVLLQPANGREHLVEGDHLHENIHALLVGNVAQNEIDRIVNVGQNDSWCYLTCFF